MKRLLVTEPSKAAFEDVADPICPEDRLLVRATKTAISTGSEVRVYRGIAIDEAGKFIYPGVPLEYPLPNGYSMVGRVVGVGRSVDDFSVGDRVFATAYHQEVAAVPAATAVGLPDSVSDEQAAFLNILEVGHVALRRGHPAPGETVAILGLGIVGLSALAYCVAFGFRTVALDPSEVRRSIADSMGADLTLDPTREDINQVVLDFNQGEGVDLVLEAASSWTAIQVGLELVRQDGRIVVVSRHTAVPTFNPLGGDYLSKRIALLTSYAHPPDGDRWDRRHSIALTLHLISKGTLPLGPMITHRSPWSALPTVYERLAQNDRSMIGVVVDWS